MPAAQKIRLLVPVNTRRDVPQSMAVGIDETMAWGDIARRPYSHQTERGAARMRFVDSLIQLRQCVAHIREAVHFAAQGILQILVGQYVELLQNMIHPAIVDGVKPIRRSRHRGEADLMKAEIVFQMTKDADDIGDSRRQ